MRPTLCSYTSNIVTFLFSVFYATFPRRCSPNDMYYSNVKEHFCSHRSRVSSHRGVKSSSRLNRIDRLTRVIESDGHSTYSRGNSLGVQQVPTHGCTFGLSKLQRKATLEQRRVRFQKRVSIFWNT